MFTTESGGIYRPPPFQQLSIVFCLHPAAIGIMNLEIFCCDNQQQRMCTNLVTIPLHQIHQFYPLDVSKQCMLDSQNGVQWHSCDVTARGLEE